MIADHGTVSVGPSVRASTANVDPENSVPRRSRQKESASANPTSSSGGAPFRISLPRSSAAVATQLSIHLNDTVACGYPAHGNEPNEKLLEHLDHRRDLAEIRSRDTEQGFSTAQEVGQGGTSRDHLEELFGLNPDVHLHDVTAVDVT